MNKRPSLAGVVVLAAMLFLTGMAGLEVLPEDREATALYAKDRGWPAGTVEMVNDSLRTAGWEFWFSECPNDVLVYGYRCDKLGEANHLIELLSKIQAARLTVALSPETATSPPLAPQQRHTATFSIGSQICLDRWYQRLPFEEGSKTVRVFGVHRYTECPAALEPRLTIYLGSEEISPDDLRIPRHVTVQADISTEYRKTFPKDMLITSIEAYVARHARMRPASQPGRGPSSAPASRPESRAD